MVIVVAPLETWIVYHGLKSDVLTTTPQCFANIVDNMCLIHLSSSKRRLTTMVFHLVLSPAVLNMCLCLLILRNMYLFIWINVKICLHTNFDWFRIAIAKLKLCFSSAIYLFVLIFFFVCISTCFLLSTVVWIPRYIHVKMKTAKSMWYKNRELHVNVTIIIIQ